MSVRNLDTLFQPRSIAVVGASNRPNSVGRVLMRNLLEGGFSGPILPVHPTAESVCGVLAYPDVAQLPIVPDVAVIGTPPATVPAIVESLAQRGTRGAIVLTAGLGAKGSDPPSLQDQMLAATGKSGLRLLGPNCVGLLVPGIGLNASFAHAAALPGPIAFLSQSGALCTAVLDWARARGIGFSNFVSIGDSADVDFGDLLDHFGADPNTRAILMYIESIRDARKFLSAGRAAARNKTVILIKAGRAPEGARAAASHTGALAGSDDVYDAAFRRAGMLRVEDFNELFAAVETIARAKPLRGERLAILTNGGGPGVLATDSLIAGGGGLAELRPETQRRLDSLLPPTWSKGNPVDIIGDAGPERYARALEALLDAEEVDAVLVLHVPVALASAVEVARAILPVASRSSKSVLTSWIGEEAVAPGRESLTCAGVPTYDTPGEAIEAFLQVIRYQRHQRLLLETPSSLPSEITPDLPRARSALERARQRNAEWLDPMETQEILASFSIPIAETRLASDAEDSVRVADSLGYPVALKVRSADLLHKSDVGGVVLHIEDGDAVRHAARAILERVARDRPEAQVEGFSLQRMVKRPGAYELLLGLATDSVFGPVIVFGQGGTATERIADRALALPPLNAALARNLIRETRVFELLRGFRDRPSVDFESLTRMLTSLSQLVVDLPEVIELDLNPVLADASGAVTVDARIRIGEGRRQLAIRPYPKELEEVVSMEDGSRVLLRPIRPEDEAMHQEFFEHLSPGDIHFRFFGLVRRFGHSEMTRFTQIDYDRELAFIAVRPATDSHPETIGVVRAAFDPDNIEAEFAIIVRSDLKGKGLGRLLMDKLIRTCRARGTRRLVGQVFRENEAMLALSSSLGFERAPASEPEFCDLTLRLEE